MSSGRRCLSLTEHSFVVTLLGSVYATHMLRALAQYFTIHYSTTCVCVSYLCCSFPLPSFLPPTHCLDLFLSNKWMIFSFLFVAQVRANAKIFSDLHSSSSCKSEPLKSLVRSSTLTFSIFSSFSLSSSFGVHFFT